MTSGLWWVWVPEPFDIWFGPYLDPEPRRESFQKLYATVNLIIVPDSKIIRHRMEVQDIVLGQLGDDLL